MLAVSNDVKNLFKTSSSIELNSGCTIEYNLNTMVNFTANSVTTTDAYVTDTRKRFKKLFPVDSIVKAYRPSAAGIRYAIIGDNYRPLNPTNVKYAEDYRVYIPGSDTYYKYWLGGKGEAVELSINYPKTILVNKIVVKFEISHSTPTTWTISRKKVGGSFESISTQATSSIKSFASTGFDAGTITLYYNGTTWSSDEAALDISKSESITDIKLNVGAVSGKYIGVVEFSPRLVRDVSQDIESFNIKQESSASTDDIIPVGYVSANSCQLELNRYDNTALRYITYSKQDTTFEADKIYLYRNAEVRPYFKVKLDGEWIKIPQGTFYMDSWSISEFGDVSLTTLDGAKILMEIVTPDVLCKDFSVAAILRTLLDTIGFTNYKFNIKSDLLSDNGIISPKYWWTENNKTVWESIQELCKDAQITAVFDQNNVLQFYTRDYFYSEDEQTKPTEWIFSDTTFTESLSGSPVENKPSIVSLAKEELPSANKIAILWSGADKANYLGDSQSLWKSEETYLGALGVMIPIPVSITPDSNGNTYIKLKPIVTSFYSKPESLYSFSGYLLIDSEIIEYDAIQYQYYDKLDSLKTVDIKVPGDMLKHRGEARSSETKDFWATGQYRVKTRGALGTTATAHAGASATYVDGWVELSKAWG